MLDADTESELGAGAGGELGRLTALRSSSALAVNVFGPWRSNPGPIAEILGGSSDSQSLRFEGVFPTGLAGTPPHLDVVIEGGLTRLGVESKFLESYGLATNGFSEAYFTDPELWNGLEDCRRLAEDLATEGETFQHLHAAQLLKHALGLAHGRDPFRLVLVWYRVDGPTGEVLDDEISRFRVRVQDDIDFEAVTYQNLFDELRSISEPTPGYLDYLADRYFPMPETLPLA